MRVRVGQTGPGLIDVEDSALRGPDDDNYEDEQQMSWLPTLRTLPSTVWRVLTGQGGVATTAYGSHTQLVLSARLCRMADIRSGHTTNTTPPQPNLIITSVLGISQTNTVVYIVFHYEI